MDDRRTELRRRLAAAVERDPAGEESLRLAAAALEIETECRLAEPFAPMTLVLTGAGLQWCCTHHPQHCAGEAAGLR